MVEGLWVVKGWCTRALGNLPLGRRDHIQHTAQGFHLRMPLDKPLVLPAQAFIVTSSIGTPCNYMPRQAHPSEASGLWKRAACVCQRIGKAGALTTGQLKHEVAVTFRGYWKSRCWIRKVMLEVSVIRSEARRRVSSSLWRWHPSACVLHFSAQKSLDSSSQFSGPFATPDLWMFLSWHTTMVAASREEKIILPMGTT